MVPTTLEPKLSTKSSAVQHATAARLGRQLYNRTDEQHAALCNTFAVTFRPGDRTGSFIDKTLRPIGCAVLIALSYGYTKSGKRSMTLAGYRADVAPDGFVTYGGAGPLFFKDAAQRPRRHARGVVLDIERDTSLIELAAQMDRACNRQLGRTSVLPRVPRLPRILLGFAPDQPPPYETTAALRALAARRLGVPLHLLDGKLLVDQLLESLWHESFIQPDASGNSTGLLLTDAEYCTHARAALRIYEDFGRLLGSPTWNPVRAIVVQGVDNPAAAVRAQLGFANDHQLDAVSGDELAALEAAMHDALGPVAERFDRDEILDGLVAPDRTLVAWREALPLLRARLTVSINEATTDSDLLQAARRPLDPLFASGAAGIQVLGKSDDGQHELGSARLGRRILLKLN